MSDTSADAGVVQSRVQLERLVAEDELAGRTIAGFAAPSVGIRAVDLDGVTLERLDLHGADTTSATHAATAAQNSKDAMEKAIEQIKERVHQLLADAARNQELRNGPQRRP